MEEESSYLEITVFLLLKIPEEHDLESQIRKEREWRFLRNTRVRKQAQQLIQKGKHCPQGPPRSLSRRPPALVQGRSEAGRDARGREECQGGAPPACLTRPGPRRLCAFDLRETWKLSGIIIQGSSGLNWQLLDNCVFCLLSFPERKEQALLRPWGPRWGGPVSSPWGQKTNTRPWLCLPGPHQAPK